VRLAKQPGRVTWAGARVLARRHLDGRPHGPAWPHSPGLVCHRHRSALPASRACPQRPRPGG
jgi:hypothetical protein